MGSVDRGDMWRKGMVKKRANRFFTRYTNSEMPVLKNTLQRPSPPPRTRDQSFDYKYILTKNGKKLKVF
jgi:hypothetical protein